jgi:hypothetical protein
VKAGASLRETATPAPHTAPGSDTRAGPLRWCEDHAPAGLAVVLTLVATFGVATAARLPLWNDELFTYYFGHLPGLDALWGELSRGAEQTPPGFYLITRASIWAFGSSPLALRLPEIVGFVVACAFLYLVVRRRSSPLAGLVAALILGTSSTRAYAVEARPYALVLGLSAVALWSWQRAAEHGRQRRLALVVLGLSLAGAVSSHYYAVLLLGPFAVALVVRARTDGRFDWPAALALGGGIVPLVVFSPLLASAADYAATFWAVPTWAQSLEFYGGLAPVALPAVSAVSLPVVAGGVTLAALVIVAGVVRQRGVSFLLSSAPVHEWVLYGALALLPVAGVVIAKLVTGAYVARYVLPAVLGLAALVALVVHRLDRRIPVAAPAAGVLLVVLVTVAAADLSAAGAEAQRRLATVAFLDANSGGRPVVVASAHEFFELSHDIARRGGPELRYLADPDLALTVLGTDTIELGLVQLQEFAPLQLRDFDGYLRTHDDFLLFGAELDWDWTTEVLRERGYRFEVQAAFGAVPLYRVVRP